MDGVLGLVVDQSAAGSGGVGKARKSLRTRGRGLVMGLAVVLAVVVVLVGGLVRGSGSKGAVVASTRDLDGEWGSSLWMMLVIVCGFVFGGAAAINSTICLLCRIICCSFHVLVA